MNFPAILFDHRYGSIVLAVDKVTGKKYEVSSCYKFIYILNNILEILSGEDRLFLKADDLFFQSPDETYSFSAEQPVHFLVVMFNKEFVRDLKIDPGSLAIKCCSSEALLADRFATLRIMLGSLVKNTFNSSFFESSQSVAIIYEIFHELLISFGALNQSQPVSKSRSSVLNEIIRYISNNYCNHITLNDLAAQYFFSTSHLSKLIKKELRCTFQQFITGIRLQNALISINSSNLSIQEIAAKTGFPSARILSDAFRRQYGVLPSKHRQQQAAGSSFESAQTKAEIFDYLDQNHFLDRLFKCSSLQRQPSQRTIVTEVFSIDTRVAAAQLKHTWKSMMTVQRASDLLRSEKQELISRAKKDVGYEYIRFHNVLSDEMALYFEDHDGNQIINFSTLDQAFDFLVSIGLKPFVELSFMPALLAAKDNRTMPTKAIVNSMPKDIAKWDSFIKMFTEHLISRYGRREVEKWPFTVWNLPHLHLDTFGFDSMSSFFTLYSHTCRVVKTCSPAIQFGFPAVILNSQEAISFNHELYALCHEAGLDPDFYCASYYPVMNNIAHKSLPESSSDMALHLNCFEQSVPVSKPIYILEWNCCFWMNQLRDSCFNAVYVTKNILENYDRVQSMAFWTVSDINTEISVSNDMFYGGFGMFNKINVPKPVFYAFTFLSKLKDTLVAKGDGYFITRDQDELVIILYNYLHYSESFGKASEFSNSDRMDSAFDDMSERHFAIELCHLTSDRLDISESILNQQSGDSFSKWIEMGSAPLESKLEKDTLEKLSNPHIKKSMAQPIEGRLVYHARLKPFEVRLVSISKAK